MMLQKRQMYKDLFKIIRKIFTKKANIVSASLAFVFLLTGIIINISIPFLFKKIIESVEKQHSAMFFALISYSLMWTFSRIIPHLKDILTHKIKEESSKIFVIRLIEHIYKLPVAYFIENQVGSILNIIKRVQNNFSIMLYGIFFFILPLLLEIIITSIGLAIYYPLKYMLILFVLVVIFIFYNIYFMQILLKKRQTLNEIDKKTDTFIAEYIMQYELIKSFNQAKFVSEKCQQMLSQRESKNVQYFLISDYINLGQSIIWGIGLGFITYIMGIAVINKELTLGDFVLFHGYLIQFITPIGSLSFFIHSIRKSITDFKDALCLFQIKPSIYSKNKAVSPSIIDGLSIEFRNVTFSHNNRVILDNISFKIKPNQKVGILGISGEGKTTILKLIMRLYDVDKGDILINGHNIKDISLEWLYKHLGIVHQETYLFNDSIYNNLCLGNSKASVKEVTEVLRLVRLSDMIAKLPEKHNTIVGNEGKNLSGGEKQRLSIARLFLKNPAVALFDEPTASIDQLNSINIEKSIIKMFKKRTLIIISHHFSTVKNLDKVIIINNGKIKDELYLNSQSDIIKIKNYLCA